MESGTRRVCVTFLSWMIRIQANRQYVGTFRRVGKVREIMDRWVLSLPKLLWRAGSGNTNAHPILQATYQAIQVTMLQKTTEDDMVTFSRKLQLSFVPYFFVTLPQKGKSLCAV